MLTPTPMPFRLDCSAAEEKFTGPLTHLMPLLVPCECALAIDLRGEPGGRIARKAKTVCLVVVEVNFVKHFVMSLFLLASDEEERKFRVVMASLRDAFSSLVDEKPAPACTKTFTSDESRFLCLTFNFLLHGQIDGPLINLSGFFSDALSHKSP